MSTCNRCPASSSIRITRARRPTSVATSTSSRTTSCRSPLASTSANARRGRQIDLLTFAARHIFDRHWSIGSSWHDLRGLERFPELDGAHPITSDTLQRTRCGDFHRSRHCSECRVSSLFHRCPQEANRGQPQFLASNLALQPGQLFFRPSQR